MIAYSHLLHCIYCSLVKQQELTSTYHNRYALQAIAMHIMAIVCSNELPLLRAKHNLYGRVILVCKVESLLNLIKLELMGDKRFDINLSEDHRP